jgi:hypothetical protein
MELEALRPSPHRRPGLPVTVEPLEVYERAGHGHTLSRHCGQGALDDAARLAEHPGLPATGAFRDVDTAQQAVARCVAAHQGEIDAWRRAGSARLAIALDLGTVVGEVLRRGGGAPLPATGVRVVLRRNPAYRSGFAVTTAYPVLAPADPAATATTEARP